MDREDGVGMISLDGTGLDEHRQQTVRFLLDEILKQPETLQLTRLHELTTDTETIAIVEHLLKQNEPVALEYRVGDVVGAWRLVAHLASGGMGTVFLGERADGLYQQRVAIKLLHGRVDAALSQRMARERQLLAQLQHPGIARLYDGGSTAGGHPYLVMEYVDGQPLHRYCNTHHPGLQARIELFQKICMAVQTAHQHLIVHCDLKPGNVLVRDDGEPVLLDFGIARALDSGSDGSGFCTPAYASLELLEGRTVSTATDVYSLGVLLAELLVAGRITHAPGQCLPAPSQIVDGDASGWRRQLRGDLDAIVAKATAPDPAQRYASVAELHAELQRYRQFKPILARQSGVAYRLQRLLRRRWREVSVALLVVALSGVFVWRVTQEREAAQRQARIAEQVSGLLADSLRSADPKNGRGNTELSARDVLDASSQRLLQVSDPAVSARLRDVLGNAYMHLGQSKTAEPLMAAAAAGYLSSQVGQPLQAAAVLAELAVLQSNGGRKQDAVTTARRALALVKGNDGQPLDLANALNSLGIALVDTDNDEARRVLEQSLAIREKYAGANSIAVASVLHNLGMLARHQAQWVQAETYYRRSLAIKQAIGETDGARFQYNLEGLAQSLRGQNRLSEAVELQREILKRALQLYGDGENVGAAYNELASTLHDLGRWAEADPNYAAAERLSAAAAGENSMAYAIDLNNHSFLYEDRGALAKAEQGFRKSLRIRRALLAPDSSSVLRATLNLARLLLREGRLTEAGPMIERGLGAWLRTHDPKHPESVGNRLLHAEWMIANGRKQQARAELTALAGDVQRTKHVAWRETLLADLARGQGNMQEALGHRQRALQAWSEDLGPEHVETARVRVAYAAALLDAGKLDEAGHQLTRARKVLAPQLAPEAPLQLQMRQLAARVAAETSR